MVPLHPGGGPKHTVPVGQRECRYGRWGKWGRAARDVAPLATGELRAVLLLIYAVSLATAVLTIPPDTPTWTRVVIVLGAVTAAVLFSALVLFIWPLRPGAYKRHWRIRFDEDKITKHVLLILESQHNHRVRNLRCVVRDPTGAEWPADWRDEYRHHVLSPGETAILNYVNDFYSHDASDPDWASQALPPWPGHLPTPGSFQEMTGRFRVRWETDVEHGERPITLARCTWRVE
jgi:hypothetical protein